MASATELESAFAALELAYAPFSDNGSKWKGEIPGLEGIIEKRDQSLAKAEELIGRIQVLWPEWESTSPPADQRARIYSARNRIVELGLAVARSDSALQAKVRHKTEELRRQAADSGHRQVANRAYTRTGSKFGA
jgi:hypothetical protein